MAGRWLAKAKAVMPKYNNAEDIYRAISDGTFDSNCLVPVLGQYQDILGSEVWVCKSVEAAEYRERHDNRLVFTVDEFLLIHEAAEYNAAPNEDDALRGVIEAKRKFGGRIEEKKVEEEGGSRQWQIMTRPQGSGYSSANS